MKEYNELILNRVDRSFRLILGFAALIAFIASAILFRADLSIIYALINFGAGLVLMAFFLLAYRIATVAKIVAVVIATAGVAVASFIGGGFSSAFLILFILSNIIAALFLSLRRSIVISCGTLVAMLVLAFYSITNNGDDIFVTWGLQFIAYILLLLALHIGVYAIKTYLSEIISKLERAVSQANKLAYHDQLTGLPNIHRFRKDVSRRMREDAAHGFIMFIKLSNLNVINSTLGQKYGNQALVEAAAVISQLKDEHTYISRIAGNEFALWLEQVSVSDLTSKFQQIQQNMADQQNRLNKKLEFYGAFAEWHKGESSYEACMQRAALTMTHVKNGNIHNLLAYEESLEKVFWRREAIKDQVEKALNNREFELYYQIKTDLRTNRVVGVEGLARWLSPELGFITPGEFIPIIESLNLSEAFGEYVIDCACSDYKHLQKKYGVGISVSVNISPSHIVNPSIIKTVEKACQRNNIPDKTLILEITEDIMIENFQRVAPILKALEASGVLFSLDDFGTGYSSLSYLTHLPIHELKIDKSFMDQITANERILILIENVVHMAREFNLTVIAEGVETKAQLEAMRQLDCHLIQGYFYGKPEPLKVCDSDKEVISYST